MQYPISLNWNFGLSGHSLLRAEQSSVITGNTLKLSPGDPVDHSWRQLIIRAGRANLNVQRIAEVNFGRGVIEIAVSLTTQFRLEVIQPSAEIVTVEVGLLRV